MASEAPCLARPRTLARQFDRADTRPTVCQVLHTLQVGGAEVLAARLARQLRDKYRFLFVCLDGLGTLGEELQADGYSVEVLNRRAGLDWRAALRLARPPRRGRGGLFRTPPHTTPLYPLLGPRPGRRAPLFFP